MIDRIRRNRARCFPSLFAGAAVLGCLLPNGLDARLAGALLATGMLIGRRVPLLIATVVLAGALANDGLAGLRPMEDARFDGEIVLIGDPRESSGAVRVDAETDLGRLEVVAFGAAGRHLMSMIDGDRTSASGRISELLHPERTRHRHLRNRLTIERFTGGVDHSLILAPVNAVRSVMLRGSSTLPTKMRPIYGGFIIGDDRGITEEVVEEFERSGLSHLLVVSGENLVFLMAVASPLLDRVGRRSRIVATLSLLVFFAALTRFEPSVLRATVMTGVATFGVAVGRPVQAFQRLAISVGLLLLIDPMLLHSFGFRLSVAATAGIVLIAPRIAGIIPGPRWIATGTAVTISAQLAVAPLVVPIFGPMRLVSIPANVLADPVAGIVMMWGCTAGLLAGVLGGPFMWILQLPTTLALWWIMTVARVGSSVPSPALDLPLMAACVAAAITSRRWAQRRSARRSATLPG